ncbi:MAG: hypothetical protein AAF458_08840 [Pseudomonadota bacterium]
MSDIEEAALRADALKFIDRYLTDALDAASSEGANPAVTLYALLECAMKVAQAHFPEHAGQLYASATQMVYEVHDSDSA